MATSALLLTKTILANFGISISKSLPVEEVRSLLRRFRPLDSGLDLIRVGGVGDGSYLIPDVLGDIDGVFSPGVGLTSNFELYFADRGVPCFMLDGSISSPPQGHEKFDFESKWLSAETSSNSISLDEWVAVKAPSSKNLILQIDIEGSEYECLLATNPKTLEKFKVIVLEIHDLLGIETRFGYRCVSRLLDVLEKNHHLIHTHVNNCSPPFKSRGLLMPEALELTFIRHGEIPKPKNFSMVPHVLDMPNTSNIDWHIDWESI